MDGNFEEYGTALGIILIGFKILIDFINKKKDQNDYDNYSIKRDPPTIVTPTINERPSVVSKDECSLNRELIQKWLEVEIRARILEQKIELQQFIKEEIRRNFDTKNINITDKEIDLLISEHIRTKFGEYRYSNKENDPHP